MATVEVKCRFCNQIDYVKKHGEGSMKHQRYRCYQCNKTFQLDSPFGGTNLHLRDGEALAFHVHHDALAS